MNYGNVVFWIGIVADLGRKGINCEKEALVSMTEEEIKEYNYIKEYFSKNGDYPTEYYNWHTKEIFLKK